MSIDYDDGLCAHDVPVCERCPECAEQRHRDELRAVSAQADALLSAVESALCMLCEGPEAIGGRRAREEAIRILMAARADVR